MVARDGKACERTRAAFRKRRRMGAPGAAANVRAASGEATGRGTRTPGRVCPSLTRLFPRLHHQVGGEERQHLGLEPFDDAVDVVAVVDLEAVLHAIEVQL